MDGFGTATGKNIGREIALEFAREGANVVVCDLNEENARNTANEIEEMGVGAMAAACDMRDRTLLQVKISWWTVADLWDPPTDKKGR